VADGIAQLQDYTLDPATGAAQIELPDGGLMIDFAPNMATLDGTDAPAEHNENLAEFLPSDVLSTIAGELITAIDQDDATRAEWLQQRAQGIDLLGLKSNATRTGAAGEDGAAAVVHPLLLEACLSFGATAVGEFLPAGGPVKVANTGADGISDDDLARELERDLNKFLTTTATEYYPDTDKLLFQTGWSGAGFKKGYHCPLRRRPVIESIDAKDLIVSNEASDLANASRITHVISMSNTVFKRMQIAGAYIKSVMPTVADQKVDAVDRKVASVHGRDVSVSRPEDVNRTIYECYCDYDIPGYEHLVDGEPSGLPLPYKVTIDYTTRSIVEIRRDWKEDDAYFTKRSTFVLYPFVPMFGFYPVGLLHLLANSTRAATTAWRLLLDAGMFGNYPGFLYAKDGSRQQNTDFRVQPGQAVGVDVASGGDITKAIMPLPYKEPGIATMQLVSDITAESRRIAGTTEIKTGEGNAQAPVGTTLALLEQAGMILSGVHKRLHTAQAREFAILKDLLAEDPEALWRHRKDTVSDEHKALIIRALNDYDLTPMADPNVPSRMHRLMKLMQLKELQKGSPDLYDAMAVDAYCLQQLGIGSPEQFFVKEPAQQAADPTAVIAEIEMGKLKLADRRLEVTSRDKALDRASKENIEKVKLLERLATQ
jgi:hypothetical protein